MIKYCIEVTMEVSTKVKSELSKRVVQALNDETNETELEFRVSKPIEKVNFDRVLRYCRDVFAIHKPVEDSLDISQDRGSYRATINDLGQMIKMCSSDNSTDVGEQAIFIKKELLSPKIELTDYGVAITLKRENSVVDKEGAIKSMFSGRRLQNYRLKRRYSFFADDGLFSIDLTVVKQKVGPKVSVLYNVKERYEVEIELLPPSEKAPDEIAQRMLELSAELLMVMNGQSDGELLKTSDRSRILSSYSKLVGLPDYVVNRFIGPQPVTLERSNLVQGIEGSFDVIENYTVTEKADGNRHLLYINEFGQGYLLDMQLNPIVTDIMVPQLKSTIFDGELVTKTKIGTPINKFLVFDAYFIKGRDVRTLPLIEFELSNKSSNRSLNNSSNKSSNNSSNDVDEASDNSSSSSSSNVDKPLNKSSNKETRLSLVEESMKVFTGTSPVVSLKKFYPREDAAKIMTSTMSFEYEIDGLILTPSDVGVFQNFLGTPITKRSGTWNKVFKWKPSKDNSVDFKVVFDKTSKGDIVVSDGKMHARLLVGRNGVGSNGTIDSYTILTGSYNAQAYELLEFDPPDYKIGNPVSWFHPVEMGSKDMPKCIQAPFEVIEDEMIVEFSWDLKRKTWVPLRIRHDKIKPNSYNTALGVWRSIAFPVDIKNLVDPSTVKEVGPSGNDDVYFARETARDGSSSQAMRRFHGYWIKNKILLEKAAKYARVDKLKLFDIAVGEAGDLRWWLDNKYDVVIGVDNVEANILGSNRGAYSRLSDAISNSKEKEVRSVKYAFVTMSGDKPIGPESIEDVKDPSLRLIADNLWRMPETRPDPKLKDYYGLADQKFDVVSLQFAIHYFFDSKERLDMLLDNIDRYLRPGGVLVGTCLDGMSVDKAFSEAKSDVLQGLDDDGNIVWKLQKRYEGELDKEGSESNMGKQIDVYLETINKIIPEHLVDFELLVKKLSERGIVPLSKKQVGEFGTSSSSETFDKTFSSYDWMSLSSSKDPKVSHNAKLASSMSSQARSYSFLNRWFVFVKSE